MKAFWYYLSAKYYKVKAWIFMQVMHLIAFTTKDHKAELCYKEMQYRFHRS